MLKYLLRLLRQLLHIRQETSKGDMYCPQCGWGYTEIEHTQQCG
jgi:protein-arginine kinase activator protein McsA